MTIKQAYRHFIIESAYCWCWLCGRDQWQRPEWWHAPWMLHRSHIVRSPRIEDPRAVVIQCPVCHDVFHGKRFAAEPNLPPITIGNLLWLKERFQPELFDRTFLQRYSVQRLPRASAPPAVYVAAYRARRHGV